MNSKQTVINLEVGQRNRVENQTTFGMTHRRRG
jgi:hypothetical protein